MYQMCVNLIENPKLTISEIKTLYMCEVGTCIGIS